MASNLTKISRLKAYNASQKLDFIFMSETYFDSVVLEEHQNMQINGYDLIKANHLSNSKKGGVCIFYKETLGAVLLTD